MSEAAATSPGKPADSSGSNKPETATAAGSSTKQQTRNDLDDLDPNFTANVIGSMGPNTSPRVREIMSSLISHLHDFALDVNLTVPEWTAAVDFVRT